MFFGRGELAGHELASVELASGGVLSVEASALLEGDSSLTAQVKSLRSVSADAQGGAELLAWGGATKKAWVSVFGEADAQAHISLSAQVEATLDGQAQVQAPARRVVYVGAELVGESFLTAPVLDDGVTSLMQGSSELLASAGATKKVRMHVFGEANAEPSVGRIVYVGAAMVGTSDVLTEPGFGSPIGADMAGDSELLGYHGRGQFSSAWMEGESYLFAQVIRMWRHMPPAFDGVIRPEEVRGVIRPEEPRMGVNVGR